MKRLILSAIALLALIGTANAILQKYQPGRRLIDGSQLNLMVAAVNNLTGNGTAGPVAATTVIASGNVSSNANVLGQSVFAIGGKIGYSTGSGGAVTQITTRATDVTLNKSSGTITLVSAAGSATPASFTVNDSLVLATDTIVINQQSGTDLYEIFVTAVGAGTFKVTSFTTGGTTTEQPVFNFSILKAVNN